METNEEVSVLRIYLSSTDKFKSRLLYEVIVYAAKRYGLSGATVFKGTMGFGTSGTINSTRFWELTEKLPVVVEIIDQKEKVENFIETITPYFEKIRTGCLLTVGKSTVVLHKIGKKKDFFEF